MAASVALLDPDRAEQALSGRGSSGFSTKVTYIYKMQQNEADVVAINKIDTLSRERLEALTRLVKRNFSSKEEFDVTVHASPPSKTIRRHSGTGRRLPTQKKR